MDPVESLFKGLLRVWKRVRKQPEPPRPEAALLVDQADRLELLGALLFGVAPSILPADGAGGMAGDALLLPRHVELSADPEENQLVYVYRVAFAAAARELEMDEAARGDERVGALASLLAAPVVVEHMHALFPATAAMTARLSGLELATRPAIASGSVSGLLEALVQSQLRAAARAGGKSDEEPCGKSDDERGGKSDDEPDQELVIAALDARGRAWLESARAGEVRAPDAVRAQAEALWREACRAADQEGDGLPEISIWGRLWPRATAIDEEEVSAKPSASPAEGRRRSVDLDKTIRLQRAKLGAREDKPLFHAFEKLETAEDYRGQSATPDASGNIEQMKDALSELSLGTAIRTTEDPRNLARAELLVDPGGVDVAADARSAEARTFSYPEWNHGTSTYRQGWVTVVEERVTAGDAGASNARTAREILRRERRHVDDIRAHLIRTLHRRQVQDRQTDGPEIDISAMVERHCDLVAGHTPSERLYLGARRTLREIAVLVLVDTSYSTDAWLEGRRVLDVEMQSLLVLSAALEGVMEEEVAVASFRSHSRHDVRIGVLKGFHDSWAHLRAVAPGLSPGGYTRIGAALRHGTAMLDEAHARKKLLLVMSDGKPTDYDRYEGRYGVEDVRRAVREAGQRRIHVFGLAIEKEAKLHLARMLGPGSYRILPRTSLLPEAMAQVFLGMLTD